MANRMASRHRSQSFMSAQSRPQSRASTTSVVSDRNDDPSMLAARQVHASEGPEAALLQYGANMTSQPDTYHGMPHQQPMGHHHSQSASFPLPQHMSFTHDSPYMQQDPMYAGHVRVGSVPAQMVGEMVDDKRRKGSAVTATNDKELREMLAKNEGRPLREVAQEVIQKERTPMAEKTKQLFAMLW